MDFLELKDCFGARSTEFQGVLHTITRYHCCGRQVEFWLFLSVPLWLLLSDLWWRSPTFSQISWEALSGRSTFGDVRCWKCWYTYKKIYIYISRWLDGYRLIEYCTTDLFSINFDQIHIIQSCRICRKSKANACLGLIVTHPRIIVSIIVDKR